jgi:hypothetical protein
VAQLNLYVPNEVADRLKREAAHEGLSLSGYVLRKLEPTPGDSWPEGYFDSVCGFLQEDICPPDDPPPDEIEDFEDRE